jgi:hypothetical protein
VPRLAVMQLRKFIEEVLVDGSLYHVLECGHVHPAINTGYAMTPAEEQPCEACEKAEAGRLPN